MRIVIGGEVFWLWRAIDISKEELYILLQKRRNTKAAKRFFRKVLKGQGFSPRVMVTDKLKSYESARKTILKFTEHRKYKRLNNLIENSHQSTRQKERQMRKIKNPGNTLIIAAHGQFLNLFKIGRYKYQAFNFREKMKNAFVIFKESALVALYA